MLVCHFFAYYFFCIKRLISENNTQLTFEWHDPKNDKRHGIIKNMINQLVT